MSDEMADSTDPERLLARLDDPACHYCDGDLAMGTYKGSGAVVCRACGTPAIRVW